VSTRCALLYSRSVHAKLCPCCHTSVTATLTNPKTAPHKVKLQVNLLLQLVNSRHQVKLQLSLLKES
jgi:hypothetical protein